MLVVIVLFVHCILNETEILGVGFDEPEVEEPGVLTGVEDRSANTPKSTTFEAFIEFAEELIVTGMFDQEALFT